MACAPRSTGTVTREGDLLRGTGTVRLVTVEGGFYAIHGDDKETYDPTNLPEEYRSDGLRVRFTAKLRSDMASIHMVGPIIEIVEIEKL